MILFDRSKRMPVIAGEGPLCSSPSVRVWTGLGPQRPSNEARLASKDNVALAEHCDRRYRTGSIASTLTKSFRQASG
ncbi:hypothetical protein ACVW1A_000180 [Bradyrhizobium sp. LB1.3]